MTFLNPLALFGLAAAAIPIIIHLLNLRKLRTVDFSSLRFLKELQKSTIRRLKIRQILLLVLRTGLVIALVFAFSRPALRGSLAGVIGGHTSTTMFVIVDDSPSMSVRTERGTLFGQAKEAAHRIVASAKQGDEVHLSTLSALVRSDRPLRAHTPEAAGAVIRAMNQGKGTVPFGDALTHAAAILNVSTRANQEIFLVTDLQASQFRGGADTTARFNPRTSAFLVEIPSPFIENSGIASLELRSQILMQNRPISLQAEVRNAGSSPLRSSTVSVYLDGSRVAQQLVDIPARSSARSTFTVLPRHRGILRGHAQLEEDAFEADNIRHFVLTVPAKITVLLAGPDIRYPSLALSLAGDTALAGLFSTHLVTERDLPAADLAAYEVLVLCGLKEFSGVVAERVAQFVTTGGGLIVFPGSESDIANYNQTLFSRVGIPPARHAVGNGGASGFLSFQRVDYAHPIIAGLFQPTTVKSLRTPTIESPKVFRSVGLNPGPHGTMIISLSNGMGFLMEYDVRDGRVFLFAVEAGLTWSDFPVKGLFAPLIHRAVMYLGAQSEVPPACTVGDRLRFQHRLQEATNQDIFAIFSPSGVEERVKAELVPATRMARFLSAPSDEEGIYELRRIGPSGAAGARRSDGALQAVAVNIDTSESDLRRAADPERRLFWDRFGIDTAHVHSITSTGPVEGTVEESRFGVELWKYFLGLAVLLAFAEMIVGREPAADTGHAEQQ